MYFFRPSKTTRKLCRVVLILIIFKMYQISRNIATFGFEMKVDLSVKADTRRNKSWERPPFYATESPRDICSSL